MHVQEERVDVDTRYVFIYRGDQQGGRKIYPNQKAIQEKKN